jgi:catechol 2,3-dioxygenase-like lactoylglutathione lyase family enzyme
MQQNLAHIAIVVRDYDEAIDWYTRVLGFELIEDTLLTPGKRWVLVKPRGSHASLLLAKAANPEQSSRIGNQTGGRVFLFLHTDNFERDYANYTAGGVKFVEQQPRREAYGTVIVFEDLYGNRWDLIERKVA